MVRSLAIIDWRFDGDGFQLDELNSYHNNNRKVTFLPAFFRDWIAKWSGGRDQIEKKPQHQQQRKKTTKTKEQQQQQVKEFGFGIQRRPHCEEDKKNTAEREGRFWQPFQFHWLKTTPLH